MKAIRWFPLLLAVLPLFSFADTVNLTWTNPTKNTNGTAVGTILSTRLEYGTCSGSAFGTKSGEWVQTGAAAASTSPDLAPSTWCFRAYTKTANGESAASNVAQKAIPAPLPNPPTNLVADASNLTAYGISQTPDKLTTFPVGTISAGTACDPSTTLNGLYRVPRSAVQWAGNVMPAVTFAACVPGG